MPKSERSFRYQKRSLADIKERANARSGNFDSFIKPQFKFYKVRDGKNLIRILPPTWEKARHYGFNIFLNYGIGADKQTYLSLSKMGKGADPIAEARHEAQKEGEKELVRELEPRERILVWLIDRLDEDEGPQLWPMPFTVDKDIASISFDDDTKEVAYIDDPEEGCDLRFHKEGQMLLTKYPAGKMKLQAAAPIHEDEKLQNEWLDFIADNPVPDCLQFYDYKHIAGVFDGQVRNAAEDEDETPKPRKRAAEAEEEIKEPVPRKRTVREEPEDEDEPKPRSRRQAEPEEEPDDEPKRPATRTRSKVAEEEPEKDAGESIRDRLKRRRSGLREPDAEPEDED